MLAHPEVCDFHLLFPGTLTGMLGTVSVPERCLQRGHAGVGVESVPMEAILAAVEPYTIHGTPYVRIVYALKDEPDTMREGRVAAEGIYKNAAPGDRVRIRVLLGVIDEVAKLESQTPGGA